MQRHWARETIRFTRDVREGMDLYFARHGARHGLPLARQRGASTRDIHHEHDKREDH